jgi:hypothetical protein
MPLSVVLQGIDRTRRLEQAFPSNTPLEDLLPLGDTSFPMLGFIGPYGDTLFSGLQMKLFIPEWDRVMRNVTDKADTEFLFESASDGGEVYETEPHIPTLRRGLTKSGVYTQISTSFDAVHI